MTPTYSHPFCLQCDSPCCMRFVLPVSPDELKASYLNEIKICEGHEWDAAIPRYLDIVIIQPMVRYLGAFDFDPATGEKTETPLHHYSCDMYDREKKLCRIYEKRAQMCRIFPPEGICRYTNKNLTEELSP